MRIFAISDIHVDYDENRKWVQNLSRFDYQQDLLILAGDVSESRELLQSTFQSFKSCFKEVCFVPGNHDLWVRRDLESNSLTKFRRICEIADSCEIRMKPYQWGNALVVPLLGWYDFSFGLPTRELLDSWVDWAACKWPDQYDELKINYYFAKENELGSAGSGKVVISFSHFLPRIDVMPFYIGPKYRQLYPVLGSIVIEEQLRQLGAKIHIYGHSHVNTTANLSNVKYINNAFGYPNEKLTTTKELQCIYDET